LDKLQIQNTNNEVRNVTTFKQNKISNPTFGKLSEYKSKLIGSTSLVKLIQMLKQNICFKTLHTTGLTVFTHQWYKSKFFQAHKLKPQYSNILLEDYKMKCIEIKNCRKSLDFSITSVIDYVLLNLINCERKIINRKGEDMQSTSKFLAYLRHNVLQRGEYIT
jgi:hypothetical protein